MNRALWYCFLALIFALHQHGAKGRLVSNILTNEVTTSAKGEELLDLPYCRSGSACGVLQVNAFGVSKEQICLCPMSTVCPLHWDPEDGHSITTESQQYKFCGPVPQLSVCKRSEPAYSHSIFFDQVSFDVIGVMAKLLCFCPPPRSHVFLESTDDAIENMHVLSTVHTCSMLPKCEATTPCKQVSMARKSSLVTTNCKCPNGLVCPTLSPKAVENDLNENFINGKVYSIHCQPWY